MKLTVTTTTLAAILALSASKVVDGAFRQEEPPSVASGSSIDVGVSTKVTLDVVKPEENHGAAGAAASVDMETMASAFRLRATASLDSIQSQMVDVQIKGGNKIEKAQAGINVVEDSTALLADLRAETETVLSRLMEEAANEDSNNSWAPQLSAAYQASVSHMDKALKLLPKMIENMKAGVKDLKASEDEPPTINQDHDDVIDAAVSNEDQAAEAAATTTTTSMTTKTRRNLQEDGEASTRRKSKDDRDTDGMNHASSSGAIPMAHHKEALKQKRIFRKKLEGDAKATHHFDRLTRVHDALHRGDTKEFHRNLASFDHHLLPRQGQRQRRRHRRTQEADPKDTTDAEGDGDDTTGGDQSGTPAPEQTTPTLTPAELKAHQCRLLMECVSQMSTYDMMLYFYSDDINPTSGEIDNNIYIHDDAPNVNEIFQSNAVVRARREKGSLAVADYTYFVPDNEDWCDDTLQKFHRNVEFGEIPHWEGATVSQVCLAQGSHTYVRLDEIAVKVGLQAADQVSKEMFDCSKDLYNSGANVQRLSPFPFARDDKITINESGSSAVDGADTVTASVSGFLDDDRETSWTSTLGVGGLVYSNSGCLDVQDDGETVRAQTCDSTDAKQLWHFDPATKQIKNEQTDKCLEAGASTAASVQSCDGSLLKQKWVFDQNSMLRYYSNPSKCLERETGNNAQFYMKDCEFSSSRQAYSFASGNENFLFHYKDSVVVANGKCIQAETDTGVRSGDCEASSSSQLWEYDPDTEHIINKSNNKCLARQTSDNNVVVADCVATQNTQKWFRSSNAIKSRSDTNMCLKRENDNNGNIKMTNCESQVHQKFFFAHQFFDPPAVSFKVDFQGTDNYFVDAVQINWARGSNGEYQNCAREDIKMYADFSGNVEVFFTWMDDLTIRWNEDTTGGVYSSDELLSQTAFLSSGSPSMNKIQIKCTKPLIQLSLHTIKVYGSLDSASSGQFHWYVTRVPTSDYLSDFLVPSGIETSLSRDEYGQLQGASETLYEYDSVNIVAVLQSARHIMAQTYFRVWRNWLDEDLSSAGDDYARAELRAKYGDPRHPNPENHGGDKYPLLYPYGTLDSYEQADFYIRMLNDAEENGVVKDQMFVAFGILHDNSCSTTSEMQDCEDEFDEFNDEVKSRYEAIQFGFNLVYGKEASVGYVCGVMEAVHLEELSGGNGADKFPGSCCLDAPYQNQGDDWGRKFNCGNDSCTTMGPFFSGLSEESCSTAGGTWCPSLVNCAVLKECVESEIDAASNPRHLRKAYVAYLEPGVVMDPHDFHDCSDSRQYFGFDPLFKNDAEICDNIKQLHNTRDFEFLDEFYDQGTEDGGSFSKLGSTTGYSGTGYTHQRIDNSQWDDLTRVDSSSSSSFFVQNGPDAFTALYSFGLVVTIHDNYKNYISNLKCVTDPSEATGNTCKLIQNYAYTVSHIVHTVMEGIHQAMEYLFEVIASTNNIQPIEDWEVLSVQHENNDKTFNRLRDTFDAVVKQDSNLEKLGRELLGSTAASTTGKIGEILDKLQTIIDGGRVRKLEEEVDPYLEILGATLLGGSNDSNHGKIGDILSDLKIIKDQVGLSSKLGMTTGSPSETNSGSLHHHKKLSSSSSCPPQPSTYELQAEVISHSPKQIVVMTTLNGAAVDYGSLAIKAVGGATTKSGHDIASVPFAVVALEEGTVLVTLEEGTIRVGVISIWSTYTSTDDDGEEHHQQSSKLLSFGVPSAQTSG